MTNQSVDVFKQSNLQDTSKLLTTVGVKEAPNVVRKVMLCTSQLSSRPLHGSCWHVSGAGRCRVRRRAKNLGSGMGLLKYVRYIVLNSQ
ncbi:hypothetical protein M5689_020194 [Euphorbia peplus]|nr:hypothetical protein M5689_020194 [Euphorbia peplus]